MSSASYDRTRRSDSSRTTEHRFFLRLSIVTVASRVNVQQTCRGHDWAKKSSGARRSSSSIHSVQRHGNGTASSLITPDTHVTTSSRPPGTLTILKGISTRLEVSPERASARDCSLASPRPRVCHEIADYHRSRKPPTLPKPLNSCIPAIALITYLCHGLIGLEKLLSTGADRSDPAAAYSIGFNFHWKIIQVQVRSRLWCLAAFDFVSGWVTTQSLEWDLD